MNKESTLEGGDFSSPHLSLPDLYVYHLQYSQFSFLAEVTESLNESIKPNLKTHEFILPYWEKGKRSGQAPILITGFLYLGIALQHPGANKVFYSSSNKLPSKTKQKTTPSKLQKIKRYLESVKDDSDFLSQMNKNTSELITSASNQISWLTYNAENAKWYFSNKAHLEGVGFNILRQLYPNAVEDIIIKFCNFLEIETPNDLYRNIRTKEKNRARQKIFSYHKKFLSAEHHKRLEALEVAMSLNNLKKISLALDPLQD